MKKLLLILLCLPMIGFGQLTYVPDDNFEQALINLGYDNVLDDYVTTSNIDTVTSLQVSGQNISDLTGIENFIALADLYCNNNPLTFLDVSANIALENLYCESTQLTTLDVSANIALENLYCGANYLTSLDVSANIALTALSCAQNQLTCLDVSANIALTTLICHLNQFVFLDVRNGNNFNMWFQASGNMGLSSPNLNCINVDDAAWSTTNWSNWWNIPPAVFFSTNCPPVNVFGCIDTLSCNYNACANTNDGSCNYNSSSYDTLSITTSVYTWNSITITTSGDYSDTLINTAGCDSIANLNLTITNTTGLLDVTNTEKTLLKITDMLGQEIPYRRNQSLFYIYDDGTVEKRIIIE